MRSVYSPSHEGQKTACLLPVRRGDLGAYFKSVNGYSKTAAFIADKGLVL